MLLNGIVARTDLTQDSAIKDIVSDAIISFEKRANLTNFMHRDQWLSTKSILGYQNFDQ